MPDPDADIRARMRRALAEAESASRHHAKGAAAVQRRGRVSAPTLPVAVALLTAGALIAAIVAIGPHLHHTAVAVHPKPSPTAAPVASTLLPTLAATPLPASPPATAPVVVLPTPRPTPTWDPPPQTVTEPQLVYAAVGSDQTPQGTFLRLAAMDWNGAVHGYVDAGTGDCQCAGVPEQFPATYLQSPDGSRVVLSGTRMVAPDGHTVGLVPAGAKALAWDGDNQHLCRLDGPSSSQLSWVTLVTSRPVTTLPVVQDDFWWVLACSSARNRIVVARFHNPPNALMTMVELRSLEMSSGRVIHDRAITSGQYPRTSGDGTVVAVNSPGSTTFYDPDSGAVLHTLTGQVEHLSWYGNRAIVLTSQGVSELVDWRHDAVLWSLQESGIEYWSHELSDDLALKVQDTTSTPAPTPASSPSPSPPPARWKVVMVKPDGTATTHTVSG